MKKLAACCLALCMLLFASDRLQAAAPPVQKPKTYRYDLYGKLPSKIVLRVGDTVEFVRNSHIFYADGAYAEAKSTDGKPGILFEITPFKRVKPVPLFEVMHTFKAKRAGAGIFEIRGASNRDLLMTIKVTVK